MSFFTLTACSTTGTKVDLNLGTLEESRNHLQDKYFQAWLKQSLRQDDYASFNANLKQFSASSHLKEGSIRYEARDDANQTASAIVVTPNKLFYLAYQVPDSQETVYITNDASCQHTLHPAIQVFNHVYPTNKIVSHAPLQVVESSQQCQYQGIDLYQTGNTQVVNQQGFVMPNTIWQTQTRMIDGKPVVYEFAKGDPLQVRQLPEKVNEVGLKQYTVTPKMEQDLQRFLSNPMLKVTIDQCSSQIGLDKDQSMLDFNAMQGLDWDINRLLIINPTTYRKQFDESKMDAISQMLWNLSSTLNGKPQINTCLTPQQIMEFKRWQTTFNQLTASYINQPNSSNNQVDKPRSDKLGNASHVEYVDLADSGLPPDEINKLRQDFSNLTTYGSYSQGKVTHEFANTAQFKTALQRHGSYQNIKRQLNFVPTDVLNMLGNEFKLIGADYSGAFNQSKYNSVFRSFDNGLGKRFEINEMYLNEENNVRMTVYNEAINFNLLGYPATLQKIKGTKDSGTKEIYDLDFIVGNRSFSMSAEGFSYPEFITLAQKIAIQAQSLH